MLRHYIVQYVLACQQSVSFLKRLHVHKCLREPWNIMYEGTHDESNIKLSKITGITTVLQCRTNVVEITEV